MIRRNSHRTEYSFFFLRKTAPLPLQRNSRYRNKSNYMVNLKDLFSRFWVSVYVVFMSFFKTAASGTKATILSLPFVLESFILASCHLIMTYGHLSLCIPWSLANFVEMRKADNRPTKVFTAPSLTVKHRLAGLTYVTCAYQRDERGKRVSSLSVQSQSYFYRIIKS